MKGSFTISWWSKIFNEEKWKQVKKKAVWWFGHHITNIYDNLNGKKIENEADQKW